MTDLKELIAFRRDLHAHPELGFEEFRTAALVANRLETAGLEVARGIGGTGVVASLRNGPRAVLLRADMDALAMDEAGEVPHRSTVPGRMHACGHDGHTTMLLGAALRLAADPPPGTVHFVFQPAEEGRGGAEAMVADDLLERFPAEAAFGLHNMPGLPLGTIAVAEGPQLASSDSWHVTFRGRGTHGAKPHLGRDAVTAAGSFLAQLPGIVGREVDPWDAAVVSACALEAGDLEALNVIPDKVRIGGTARAYSEATRDHLEAAIGRHARGVASTWDMAADYEFIRRIPPVVNAPGPVAVARRAVVAALGEAALQTHFPPSTAGDDFASFSTRMPGAYVWLGMGPLRDEGGHHQPRYDFEDDCLAPGIAFWCAVAHAALMP